MNLIRVPHLTRSLRFGLKIRHTRKLLRFDFHYFETTRTTFEWAWLVIFGFIKFPVTLPYVRNIRKLFEHEAVGYNQFWALRAQYLKPLLASDTPFLRLIPTITIGVVTRFYDLFYFSHFLSLIFLYSNWSPRIKWNKYFPHVYTHSHFYEWMGGYFCYIKIL